jgi:hypothetical protein
VQVPYTTSATATEFTMIAPTVYVDPAVPSGHLNTTPLTNPMTDAAWLTDNSVDAPYQPIPLSFKKNLDFAFDSVFGYGTSFYLPAYIRTANISSIYIHYNLVSTVGSGTTTTETISAIVPNRTALMATPCSTIPDAVNGQIGLATYDNIVAGGATGYNEEGYCLDTTNPNRPVIHVKVKNQSAISATPPFVNIWTYAGIEINFFTIEQTDGTTVVNPGNVNYYLSKLGRLELLGIPQITYEPIYCTNNQQNIVPGIFLPALSTRASIAAKPTYSAGLNPMQIYTTDTLPVSAPDTTPAIGNGEKKFVYQADVDHAAVFSAKDFSCCTPLGKTPKNGLSTGCCSGFAPLVGGTPICKLPLYTDLNVYFNRFVSNEGVGTTLAGAGGTVGLIDSVIDAESDFNKYTGEPKFQATTADKIYALGVAYCDRNKVASGGVFGKYTPQPNNGSFAGTYTAIDYPTSIIDSVYDNLSGNALTRFSSKSAFDIGVRWNHHQYCRD